jgi:hypothetical protein
LEQPRKIDKIKVFQTRRIRTRHRQQRFTQCKKPTIITAKRRKYRISIIDEIKPERR